MNDSIPSDKGKQSRNLDAAQNVSGNTAASRARIKRGYKDSLFRLRFGSEEYKEDMLSIYNALNNTSYRDAKDITITTIGDVIYIKMKNDVSFLINGYLPLWEQQSSVNPNMPVRGLMYFGHLYSQYIETNKLNIYGSKLQKIPTPQYVVFYNGTKEMDAVQKLRLSDAFINRDGSGDFEWTATVYNLNSRENGELLERCRPLADYTEFVSRVNANRDSGMEIEEAVDAAVVSCIKDGIMKEFLTKHRAEVKDVCITEFNEEVYENGLREEGEIIGSVKILLKNNTDENEIAEIIVEEYNLSRADAVKAVEEVKKSQGLL